MTKEEENVFDEGLANPVESEVDYTQDESVEENNVPPAYGSVAWNDYVLDHLAADELMEGQPTVDALRRVTEELVGPIIDMQTMVHQVPTPENGERATIVVVLTVQNQLIDTVVRVSGAADAYYGNIPEQSFRRFPVAMAETRAEGRALKRLLKLRKVCSAEELAENSDSEDGNFNPGCINESQLNMLDTMCKKFDVDVEKFVQATVGPVNNIQEVSYEDASKKLFAKLSSYKGGNVPDELVGYNSDWKKGFSK